jgi:hypothetical protein
VNTLEVTGRRFGNLHAGANRSGDGDHLRGLVSDDQSTRVAVAENDIHDALAGTNSLTTSASQSVDAALSQMA